VNPLENFIQVQKNVSELSPTANGLARLNPVSLVLAAWSLFLVRTLLLQTLKPLPGWLVVTQGLTLGVCVVLCVLTVARALRRDVGRKARRLPLFFASMLLSVCTTLIWIQI
jgi:hypothetical protein